MGFRDFLKESKVSPGRRRPGGRSFHSRGPAAEKLLSPSLLCVRGTNSFRMSLKLDRSGRRPTSDRRQQSSARYAGAYLRKEQCNALRMLRTSKSIFLSLNSQSYFSSSKRQTVSYNSRTFFSSLSVATDNNQHISLWL